MQESPFIRKKVILKREESFWDGTVLASFNSASHAFVKAIPSDDVKQLPPKYLFPVGSMVFFLLGSIFVAIFVPGYISQIRTQFLAPLGSGNSRYCEDVTISNSGQFLATRSGYWEGSEQFSYANGSYVLSATNLQITSEKLNEQFKGIYFDMLQLGKYASKHDLGVNLLIWMSWVEVQYKHDSQRFSLTGTPLSVFNRDITAGTVSTETSDCNSPSTSSFNPSSGEMQATFTLEDYNNNPNCTAAGTPEMFGYKSYIHTNTFSIKFDIRSVITCIALNSHVTSPMAMQKIDSDVYTYKNFTYLVEIYVDSRYPGMKPVRCMYPRGRSNDPYCMLTLGNIYALPVFNHAGNSFDHPSPCNCSLETTTTDIATNPYNLCNIFNFLTGFIFYPVLYTPDPILNLMFRYPNNTGHTINKLAFTAMFTAGIYGQSSQNRSSYDSPAQRAEMYSFCRDEQYGNCSIVTFNSVDNGEGTTDWVVAASYYQVRTGACSDSFSASVEAWERLVEQPFAPLTQQYQTCRNDPLTAFFTQIGVSAGNVSILSPLGVLLVLFILAIYQFCSGVFIPKAYGRSEKDAALDALAVALLLVRDQRLGGKVYTSQAGRSEAEHATDKENGQCDGDKKVNIDRVAHLEAEVEQTGGQQHSTVPTAVDNSSNGRSSSTNSSSKVPSSKQQHISSTTTLLNELVEALAEVAAATEKDKQLMQQQDCSAEPVFLDWSALGHKVLHTVRNISSSTSNSTTVRTKTPVNSHISSTDDVEMPTISKIHEDNKNNYS